MCQLKATFNFWMVYSFAIDRSQNNDSFIRSPLCSEVPSFKATTQFVPKRNCLPLSIRYQQVIFWNHHRIVCYLTPFSGVTGTTNSIFRYQPDQSTIGHALPAARLCMCALIQTNQLSICVRIHENCSVEFSTFPMKVNNPQRK